MAKRAVGAVNMIDAPNGRVGPTRAAFVAGLGCVAGAALALQPRQATAVGPMCPAPPPDSSATPPACSAIHAAPDALRVLVMSGGVAYGSYEAGVLKGFQDMGVRYDAVLGTSSGALNASLYAVGADAAAIWRSLPNLNVVHAKREYRRLFTPSSGIINRAVQLTHALHGMLGNDGTVQGLFETSAIETFIASHLSDAHGRALDFQLPVFWTTNDLRTTKRWIRYRLPPIVDDRVRSAVDNPDGNLDYVLDDLTKEGDPAKLATAIRSSTAIPVIFDPVVDDAKTHVFVDGGVVSNTPIGLARLFAKSGPLAIDIVQINPIIRENSPESLRSAAGLAEASLSLIEQRLMDDAVAELRLERRYQSLLHPESKNDLTVRVLYPSRVIQSKLINAFNDTCFLDDNITLGEADAKTGCWHDYDAVPRKPIPAPPS